MAYGVTSTGFVLKRLEDIRDEINTELQAEFGLTVDLSSDGPIGILRDIFAEQIAEAWEAAQAAYNSFFPSTSDGISLDRVAAINNIAREDATFSTGEVTFSGTNGTIVPAGTRVGNGSGGSVVTTAAGTVALGVATVACRAETAGDVTYAAGTLTTILTPVFGITSVTNASDVDGGQDEETDEDFRVRRATTLQSAGSSNLEGIRNALRELSYVLNAIVIENTAETTDADGRPPHSFECFIVTDLGGAIAGFPTESLEIAETIFAAKPAGIQTFGTESETVTDSQSLTHTVNFSEASEVAITFSVTVTENTDENEGDLFPATGEDLIKEALIDYVETLGIGQDVWLNKMEQAVSSIAGVKGVASAQIDGVAASKSIAASELATLATGDITITVV